MLRATLATDRRARRKPMAHPIILHLGVQTTDSSKALARRRIAPGSRKASLNHNDSPESLRRWPVSSALHQLLGRTPSATTGNKTAG